MYKKIHETIWDNTQISSLYIHPSLNWHFGKFEKKTTHLEASGPLLHKRVEVQKVPLINMAQQRGKRNTQTNQKQSLVTQLLNPFQQRKQLSTYIYRHEIQSQLTDTTDSLSTELHIKEVNILQTVKFRTKLKELKIVLWTSVLLTAVLGFVFSKEATVTALIQKLLNLRGVGLYHTTHYSQKSHSPVYIMNSSLVVMSNDLPQANANACDEEMLHCWLTSWLIYR